MEAARSPLTVQTWVNDIIPYVDRHFRTQASREGRALAGLSMGGFVVMHTGLSRLDTFSELYVYSSGQGLELRVGTYWGEEPSEHADFAPPVEAFTGALAGTTIPPRTQAMLMHPYERTGAFAKAEDALYALLEAAPDNHEVVDWGITFFER